MLTPSKRNENADYVNRQGQVVTPGPDDAFYDRRGAFVLCRADDRILSVKPVHGEGLWELPGGGVDEGESAVEAALREAYEETGVELFSGHLKHTHQQKAFLYVPEQGFWNYEMDFFMTEDPALVPYLFDGIKPSPEEGEMLWVSVTEIADFRYKHFVNDALKSLGYIK